MEEHKPDIRDQLTFKGTATSANGSLCEEFSPNKWKPMRCGNCGHDLRDHISRAVKDGDVLTAIAEEQAKDGANIILDASEECGSLHLGGFMASGLKYVELHHITHVINAAVGLENFFVAWAKQLPKLEAKGVKFLRLGWADNGGQPLWKDQKWDQLVEAVDFIHSARQAGENVVVHCAQGKSRSATVVVAYLMASNPEPLQVGAALAMIRQRRPCAEPNDGFMQQLQEFSSSTDLVALRKKIHDSK